MFKKGKRFISWLLLAAMLFSISFDGNVFAENNSENSNIENNANSEIEQNDGMVEKTDDLDNAEADRSEIEVEDNSSEGEQVENTESSTEMSQNMPASEGTDPVEKAENVSVKQGLINYVGIDLPYLETPNEQKIVVSYGDGTEDIKEAKIIVNKDDNTNLEIELSRRDGNLFLFSYNFDESASGVYQLTDFIYLQNETEQTIHLADIGIEAMFGVNEEYPGYSDSSEGLPEDVTEEEVEMSVVNVDTGRVEESTTDIQEAIETTEQEINAVKENRSSRATINSKEEGLVVVLDPGHGGNDPGAIGNGLNERDINLKIAQACKAELEEYNDVTVYMTHNGGENPSLAERVDRAANWGADVFVSIHINSAGASATGAEVWYPNSSYNESIHNEGAILSNVILQELVSLGLSGRGIKVKDSETNTRYPDGSIADYYGVIKRSKEKGFPGIIIEHAFITNPNDAAKLADSNFLKKLGIADATGIAKTYGLSKGPSIKVENKNDFVGNAQINVSGIGNNGKIKVWNEETGASKEYSIATGKQEINFDVAEYGGARGTYYIEAFNVSGESILKEEFYVSKDTSSTVALNSDGRETNYIVDIKFNDMPAEIAEIQVPVWSKEDQSDLQWLDANQISPGEWQTVINIKDYKVSGTYNVHVYVKLDSGIQLGIFSTTMDVTAPSFSGGIENYSEEGGTFEVVINDINSPSGVEKVQVPVWCAEDQSDIKWYDAEKQDDGSYKAKVSIANHSYAIGNYRINVYLTAGNGIRVGKDFGVQEVILPNTNIAIENIGNKEMQYRIQASNVELLGNIKEVLFAAWSEQGGQDDLAWYTGNRNADGNWETTVDIRDHKTAGKYKVDVYVTLANGVMRGLGTASFDVTAPGFSASVNNYKEEGGTFEVVINNITALSGVEKIQVPVWCAEDQSDIKWYDAEKQTDGSYKVKVSIANHNYSVGLYKAHVYLTTQNGLTQGMITEGQQVILPQMQINAEDISGKEMTYRVEAANVGLLGVLQNVMFAVWSEQGGQDDLAWYTGNRNADGNWETTVDIRDHKTAGKYKVDVYVTLANGVMRGLGTTSFEVQGASLVSELLVRAYNENTGEFTVVVPEPYSLSGIESVLVPVWCAEDQSDIFWYTAERQQDGTYEAKINPMCHNYHSGLYKVHIYVTSKNNIQQNVGSISQMVSTTQYYTIMGDTSVTLEQMVKYYESSGHEYPSTALKEGGASTLEQFCQMYLEEAEAEGVRAEVAFAQAMRETGWLQYGGIVKIEQFNFAGIGALDGNAVGNCATFPNVRTGIRAQIQHLKAYGSTEALNNPSVDPRFHLVKRGVAPYVEWLGIKENPEGVGWASDDHYGYKIVSMIKNLKSM